MTEIVTPVGRIVQGSCFDANTKDGDGNPLVVKHGPNAGQPRVEYYIGLAIEKTNPDYPAMYNTILQVARESFPNLFDATGNPVSPDAVSLKIIDGDSQKPNKNGNRPCDREGFPGHWIVAFNNGFAPQCYTCDNGVFNQTDDPNVIKRGYYVQVVATVKGNGSNQNPGVYLNHSMVRLVAYGKEIITRPDAATVFGAQPVTNLPAGATQTPTTPDNTVMPATDLLQPGGATPPPPPAPPSDAVLYQTPDGKTHTKEKLLNAGWGEAQIIALPTT